MSTGSENQDLFSRLSQESAEELYENAPCGYVSTTPDGLIVRANKTFTSWVGYKTDEVVGRFRFPDLLSVGGKIFYETHFALLLLVHGDVNEVALDLIGTDGGAIPCLVSATQKRDEAGTPVANRISIFNATERRRYEHELLMAKKRAEETAAELSRLNTELGQSNAALLNANEELGQFAFAASHDLQEPLRTVTAYAQLLARRLDAQLDDETRMFVANIVEGSRRMQSLIGDLLSFSQAQGSPLVVRSIDLQATVEIATSNLRSAIQESDATVTHDKLPVLAADAARFAQLFQNLIGNAIKYRKPDEAPRVHVSCTKQPGEWMFAVRDNGLGFDNKYAEQIFRMFKRLHGQEVHGTGIGLAICKKIVESHGGRIWAESVPGSGSAFYFTIPTVPRVPLNPES